MEPLWFYSRNGQQTGPVPFEELQRLAKSGELQPTDLIWQQGSPDWALAQTNLALFPIGTTPPAIPQPPTAPTSSQTQPVAAMPLDDGQPKPVDNKTAEDQERRKRSDRDRERDEDRDRRRRGDDDDEDDRDDRRRRPRYDDDDDDDYDDRRKRRIEDDPMAVLGTHGARAFGLDMQLVRPLRDEQRTLERAGIKDETGQRYAVWRRSVMMMSLFPCFLAALFFLIEGCFDNSSIPLGNKGLGPFATILLILEVLARLAMPTLVLIAFLYYQNPGKSLMFLALGWLIGYFVPILTMLVPSDWYAEQSPLGPILGLWFFLTFSPALITLLPALIRAGLRVKHLLPESVLPGWTILGGVMLNIVIGLAVFVFVYQSLSNLVFAFGTLIFLGAPALYLLRADLLIRPLTNPKQLRPLGNLRMYVLIAAYVGVLFILVYMLISKVVMGAYLLGFSNGDMFRPWSLSLHRFWLDCMGRTMLTMVLFADLLMRVNLSLWRQERDFYRTDKAAKYDATMSAIDKNLQVKEERRSRRLRRDEEDDGERDNDEDREKRGRARDRDDRW